MSLPIADHPDKLDAVWLTDALRANGHLVDGRVASVDLRPLGTGQMCDSMRIAVTYEGEADLPDSFVAKFPSSDESSRMTALIMRSYEKEVRFYQHYAESLPINTPKPYFADIDTASGSFVLLLEDASPAEQGDQIAGCSPDVAAGAVGELANLHAPRWGNGEVGDHDWLAQPTAEQRSMLIMGLPMLWEQFVDRYDGAVEPVLRRAGDTFFANIANYFEADYTGIGLTHTDYRLDNLLFAPGALGGSADPRPTVVDWQTVAVGCPAHDVGFFMGTGLSVGDRRDSESTILKQYHEAIVAAGVSGYSAADLEYEYRRGAWAAFTLLVGAAVLVERTDRGDEMFLTMLHRAANHAVDLDADEIIR